MDSKQLIDIVAEEIGINNTDADGLYSALAMTIRECADELATVAIPGFGNFSTIKRNEEIVVNEQGQKTLLPPVIEMSFTPSILLRKKMIG